MPVIKKRIGPKDHPDHERLVGELVRHLRDEPNLPALPRIVEEDVRLTSSIRVYVLWDEWQTVSERERSEIVLQAYERARGQAEMLRISVAMGLTPLEAKELAIEL